MNKIKVPVLRYKSDRNTLTTSQIKIIPICDVVNEKIDTVYLLPITNTQYQLVLSNGNLYYTIGISVFDWQLKNEAIKASLIAKIKELKQLFTSGFESYIKDQIKTNKYITTLEVELLYQFGFTELGRQAKKYMIDWKIKQVQEEQREEKENKRKELEEQEQEKQKQRWKNINNTKSKKGK